MKIESPAIISRRGRKPLVHSEESGQRFKAELRTKVSSPSGGDSFTQTTPQRKNQPEIRFSATNDKQKSKTEKDFTELIENLRTAADPDNVETTLRSFFTGRKAPKQRARELQAINQSLQKIGCDFQVTEASLLKPQMVEWLLKIRLLEPEEGKFLVETINTLSNYFQDEGSQRKFEEILMEQGVEHPLPNVRRSIVTALLSKKLGRQIVAPFLKQLMRESEPDLIELLSKGIEENATIEDLPTFQMGIHVPPKAFRQLSLKMLDKKEFAHPDHMTNLMDGFPIETDPEILKAYQKQVLAYATNHPEKGWLGLLKHENPIVKETALKALIQQASPDSFETLLRLMIADYLNLKENALATNLMGSLEKIVRKTHLPLIALILNPNKQAPFVESPTMNAYDQQKMALTLLSPFLKQTHDTNSLIPHSIYMDPKVQGEAIQLAFNALANPQCLIEEDLYTHLTQTLTQATPHSLSFLSTLFFEALHSPRLKTRTLGVQGLSNIKLTEADLPPLLDAIKQETSPFLQKTLGTLLLKQHYTDHSLQKFDEILHSPNTPLSLQGLAIQGIKSIGIDGFERLIDITLTPENQLHPEALEQVHQAIDEVLLEKISEDSPKIEAPQHRLLSTIQSLGRFPGNYPKETQNTKSNDEALQLRQHAIPLLKKLLLSPRESHRILVLKLLSKGYANLPQPTGTPHTLLLEPLFNYLAQQLPPSRGRSENSPSQPTHPEDGALEAIEFLHQNRQLELPLASDSEKSAFLKNPSGLGVMKEARLLQGALTQTVENAHLPYLLEKLKDPNPMVRYLSLTLVDSLITPKEIPVLLQRIEEEKHPLVLKLLQEKVVAEAKQEKKEGGEKVYSLLEKALKINKNPDLLIPALMGVSHHGLSKIETLINAYKRFNGMGTEPDSPLTTAKEKAQLLIHEIILKGIVLLPENESVTGFDKVLNQLFSMDWPAVQTDTLSFTEKRLFPNYPPDDRVHALFQWLDSPKFIPKEKAQHLLTECLKNYPMRSLPENVKTLVKKHLTSPKLEMRRLSAEVGLPYFKAQDIPFLIENVLTEKDPQVQKALQETLTSLSEKSEAFDTLKALATAENLSPSQKSLAVQGIQMHGLKSLPILLDSWEKLRDSATELNTPSGFPEFKESLQEGIRLALSLKSKRYSTIKDDEFVQLKRVLNFPYPEVQKLVLHILEQWQNSQSVDPLFQLLAKAPPADLEELARKVLLESAKATQKPLFLEKTASPELPVKRAAIQAYCNFSGTGDLSTLLHLYGNNPQADIREILETTIAALGQNKSTYQVLTNELVNGKNKDTRLLALKLLLQNKETNGKDILFFALMQVVQQLQSLPEPLPTSTEDYSFKTTVEASFTELLDYLQNRPYKLSFDKEVDPAGMVTLLTHPNEALQFNTILLAERLAPPLKIETLFDILATEKSKYPGHLGKIALLSVQAKNTMAGLPSHLRQLFYEKLQSPTQMVRSLSLQCIEHYLKGEDFIPLLSHYPLEPDPTLQQSIQKNLKKIVLEGNYKQSDLVDVLSPFYKKAKTIPEQSFYLELMTIPPDFKALAFLLKQLETLSTNSGTSGSPDPLEGSVTRVKESILKFIERHSDRARMDDHWPLIQTLLSQKSDLSLQEAGLKGAEAISLTLSYSSYLGYKNPPKPEFFTTLLSYLEQEGCGFPEKAKQLLKCWNFVPFPKELAYE
ncbi:MAG: hypothetical protein K2X66_16225, partial [Cyanobacteria bacterium]|nr:hypothetical protein [Cyanobacteriota bacterium]